MLYYQPTLSPIISVAVVFFLLSFVSNSTSGSPHASTNSLNKKYQYKLFKYDNLSNYFVPLEGNLN